MATRSRSPSFVDVALPVPVDKVFTYRLPPAMADGIAAGCRVLVPFGRRRMTGYVVSARTRAPGGIKLREVSKLIDTESLLDHRLLDLARWMREYYIHSLGEILKTMLPASLKGRGRFPAGDETAGSFPHDVEFPELTAEQSASFEMITKAISSGTFRSFLLHGVTGSGKTEVYLRCIGEALASGKSALVLIPEIALIPQTTSRFRRRFGSDVAVLHSRLTGAQRYAIWTAASRGEIKVVVGARSAAFVPLQNLGIIVVDEEQDTSFKQEEKPHYTAGAVAHFRARSEGAVLLLGSATPSLETYEAAKRGEIVYCRLGSRPLSGAMPDVDIIDMREREGIFSEELLGAVSACMGRKEQAIILLNRRGHANFVQCRACGWIDRCPNCSISLTYHSRGHRLTCHYCGYRHKPPDSCPRCNEHKMVQYGFGTQRVEMELSNLIPGIRILRMDLDTTTGRRGHLDILEKFSRMEADVLLGTQMVAKGHHFPNVTVVGVVAADSGLNFPDFRAAERTFQLLSQAAGRTGRGKKAGRVFIQTYAPEHYIFRHLEEHDFEGFAEQELALRYELGYPPAGRLILFTVSSSVPDSAQRGSGAIAEKLRSMFKDDGIEVLGPTPALIERLRKKYRYQVLLRGGLETELKSKMVSAARKAAADLGGVTLSWDVDPANIL